MIVNGAFPRPGETTGEAIRVMQDFCRRLSLNWRFAICIGSGPIVAITRRVPFLDLRLKKAYIEVASDMKGGDHEVRNNYLIRPIIPEPIITMMKEHYEKKGHMVERNRSDSKA